MLSEWPPHQSAEPIKRNEKGGWEGPERRENTLFKERDVRGEQDQSSGCVTTAAGRAGWCTQQGSITGEINEGKVKENRQTKGKWGGSWQNVVELRQMYTFQPFASPRHVHGFLITFQCFCRKARVLYINHEELVNCNEIHQNLKENGLIGVINIYFLYLS